IVGDDVAEILQFPFQRRRAVVALLACVDAVEIPRPPLHRLGADIALGLGAGHGFAPTAGAATTAREGLSDLIEATISFNRAELTGLTMCPSGPNPWVLNRPTSASE